MYFLREPSCPLWLMISQTAPLPAFPVTCFFLSFAFPVPCFSCHPSPKSEAASLSAGSPRRLAAMAVLTSRLRPTYV